ncbi:MAG: glycosyltransferase family 4 protein [Candidatus Bathyarchaeia archaeon]
MPDFFAGNYRRIFELLMRGKMVGIDYATIEFTPMAQLRDYVQRTLGYSLPHYQAYSVKGYGRGYNEERIFLLIVNAFKFLKKTLEIRYGKHYPDIILVPDALSSWVLYGYLVSVILRRPCVVTIQLIPKWLLESGSSDMKSLYMHFRSKYRLLKALFNTLTTSIFLSILKRCYLITVSEWTKAKFLSLVKTKKLTFVNYNGVSNMIMKKYEGTKIYDGIFIGVHDERKGILELMKVWKHVIQVKPNAKLVTCGVIPKHMKDKILDRIRDYSLHENILLMGSVSEDEKIQLLARSRIFVLPSRHEAFPIVVIEALAMGLPVVVYDIPEFKDSFFKKSKAVISIPQANTEVFAKKVIELLENTDMLKALSRIAQLHIKNLTWNAVLRKERSIYIMVIKDFLKSCRR